LPPRPAPSFPTRRSSDLVPGCTITLKLAECDRFPLVPCAAAVALPVAEDESAPKITDWDAPAFTENGLAGFEVTPVGKPDSVTCTKPVKPFCAATVTLTAVLVVPCVSVRELGESVSEKSGCGGGGCTFAPPPQPAAPAATPSNMSTGTIPCRRPMARSWDTVLFEPSRSFSAL